MAMLYSLFGSAAGFVILAMQVALIVHCLKTGRHRGWILALVLFSVLGCLVYIVVELLPSMAQSRTMRQTNARVAELVDPGRGLREEGASYALSNNVQTTQAYAEQLLRKGRHQEAIDLYLAARKGMFVNDPVLLLGLARACFAAKQFADCVKALGDLKQHHPGDLTPDAHLLQAMALEYEGRTAEALAEYRVLAGTFPGPEARCRFGSLLLKNGELDAAAEEFREIDLIAKSSPAHYQRMYREWITTARNELKNLASKANAKHAAGTGTQRS